MLHHPHVKALLGLSLIITGLILAPTGMPDDLVTTAPMMLYFGTTYVLIAMVGYILLILGVLLLGHAAFKYLGPAKVLFKHPVMLLLLVIVSGLFIWRMLG